MSHTKYKTKQQKSHSNLLKFHIARLFFRLANTIMGPGTCKISNLSIAFKQMENINNFIEACQQYGVSRTDLFQTADLYENTNMYQVLLTLYALGRKVRFMCNLKKNH